MSKNFDYSANLSSALEKKLRNAKYLGEGHNGIVFILDNKKVIKFFKKVEVWKDESYILKKSRKSRFFPKIYEYNLGYIVREFVGGVRLDKYLEKQQINEKLSEELYYMILNFEKLGFSRLDLRCKDIFVQSNLSVKIIDPKKNFEKYVPYPRQLMKGIYKRDSLELFLGYIKKRDFRRFTYWKYKIENYIKFDIK
ncbi:hypothetical protein [Clostridium tarantellae]|uniref:Serine/threonine protein kinase n=1 Tax=Clostridium tarantellae TaxID=39493 RepID=A0A6I1MNM5_9CLOT|nr:hypothetical protein [Clostridium tarantellae]MPQ44363.1 hypothetical protein [Clostridium tarantellae]